MITAIHLDVQGVRPENLGGFILVLTPLTTMRSAGSALNQNFGKPPKANYDSIMLTIESHSDW